MFAQLRGIDGAKAPELKNSSGLSSPLPGPPSVPKYPNPDLLHKDALLSLYPQAVLDSAEARARFVLPARGA
jgi:hypothetical protein